MSEKYQVLRAEDDESDARTFTAHSCFQAAKMWAADSDTRGDYSIVRGNEAAVIVRKVSSGQQFAMTVHGESVPEYSAVATQAEKGEGNAD